MPGSRRPRARGGGLRWTAPGRLSLVAILLMLAAAGARAREGTRLSVTGIIGSGAGTIVDVLAFVLVLAASIALAGLALLLGRRRRRPDDEFTPEPGPAGTWWQRALALLAVLVLAALLTAAAAAAIHGARGGRAGSGHAVPAVPAAPHLSGTTPAPGPGTGIVVLLAAVSGLAAVATAVYWQHRRRGARPAPARPPDAPATLAAAVAAGSSALAAAAGAREAIVDCYAAMEEFLATAGSPRLAADTPEELLGRAVGAGVIRTPSATRLTELFREARFSPHVLGDEQRGAAESALTEIARDLAGRQ